jgi:hypothetical protein
MVCKSLQNVCIDKILLYQVTFFFEDAREDDEWSGHDNASEDDVFLHGRASGDCRHDITAKLESLGLVRPFHAQ